MIKATVALHNYLQKSNAGDGLHRIEAINVHADGVPPLINDVVAGGLEVIPAKQLRGNRAKREAEDVRDKFRGYFCSPAGELPYQWQIVRRGQPD